MAKLNQIVSAEKGVKARTNKTIDEAYKTIQKGAPFSGIARTYQPRDDNGDNLPPERTNVITRAEDTLQEATDAFAKLFDVTASKDASNQVAVADVVVDGVTVLAKVPVTTLLFLDKQLTDVNTLVRKLPTLDPAEDWSFSAAANAWSTSPVQTVKTKKVPKNHVKAPATDKHPAQVELYYEDVVVGDWTTLKFSGAVPAARVAALAEKVEKLQDAVKFALQKANSIDAVDLQIGNKVFDFILETG